MNVRCALMDDLEEIIELYGVVSDAMKESAFDIGWRKNLYPSKEMIQSDIKQQTLYILQKEEKIIGSMVLNHESDPCYQNVYWQINVDDTEAIILHRFCIHPDFHGCGKYFLKQALKIAQNKTKGSCVWMFYLLIYQLFAFMKNAVSYCRETNDGLW